MSQSPKVRGVVDLVFLIDATGSMSPCIDALKANIGTFVSTLVTGDANGTSPVRDWRARVVGYRDFDYDKTPIEEYPFVTTERELKAQLERLEATGGGDEPESLLDALYRVAVWPHAKKGQPALPDHWRHRSAAARVVVVFTDASFKEPLAKPRGADFGDLVNQITSARIILSVFAPEMPCYEKLSSIDRSEWNVVGGGKDPQESMRLYTSDQRNFVTVLQQLAKTISKSAEVLVID
ncbi:MAG: vWA domain-containing protein [Fimbriiglobus sp.]